MEEFKWHVPIRPVTPQQVGKLTRAHYLGDPIKRWVDEMGYLFQIDYRSGGKVCLGNVTTCKEV